MLTGEVIDAPANTISWLGSENMTFADINKEIFIPQPGKTWEPIIPYRHETIFTIFDGFCEQMFVTNKEVESKVGVDTWSRSFEVSKLRYVLFN